MGRRRNACVATARGFLSSVGRSAQRTENRAGKEELQEHRETARAVPAETVVKQLPPSGTEDRQDVLQVRGGARRRTKRRRVEWTSPGGKENNRRETTADLEPRRVDVPMRKSIAREVEDRADE